MTISTLAFIMAAILIISGVLFFIKVLMGQSRNSLDEIMTRNRMESRQTLQLALNDVQAKLQTLQTVTETKLDTIRGEVDKKLSETITKNFQSFDAVAKRLEELQLVTGQVVNLSQGVRDLSRILESPKLRGAMGEFQLGEMLRQVLPSDVYEEQFAIEGKSKEAVDAVIKLKEGFLCIDSKFPLNNARILLETELDDVGIKAVRKSFSQDVKVMVDGICSKYIIAGKTLDFALMFIPAESVFYELLKDSELHQYCLKKHVIPVSPNSFYAYLQAIAVGFRGLKIQAEAKKIEITIMRLKGDFQKFLVDFSKVGKHLKDAQTQYDNVEDRVEKFGTIIDKLGLESSETPTSSMTSINTIEHTI
jgi:DNA recombination protein RmuC